MAWPASADSAPPPPRYVFLHCDVHRLFPRGRSAPASPRAFFEDFARTLRPPDNPRLRLGLAFSLSTLAETTTVLARQILELQQASEAAAIPLLLCLDGQQWWQDRPDLWNWWDPARPGFNPANARNVEWTGWSPRNAVKIGWRNWGRQLRVAPAPNIASPRVLEAHLAPLRSLAPLIARWRDALPPEKKYLCGGLKVGWEAGTGFNAFYYPGGNAIFERWPGTAAHDPQTGLKAEKGISGGVAQIGYAAVFSAGLKTTGTLTREDMALVTHRYLAALARAARQAGLPRELIFTHQGGTPPQPPEKRLPLWPAINPDSTPGWSFYHAPLERWPDLASELDRAGVAEWAAVEWLWPANSAAGWADHLRRYLSFHGCRQVTIYNWTRMVENNPAAQEGLRRLVADWK